MSDYQISPVCWVGTTACAPNQQWMTDGAVCGGGVQAGAQSCIVEWPSWQPSPTFIPIAPAPYVAPVIPQQHTHYHFAPISPRLSDDDVERIARRVAELLRGQP